MNNHEEELTASADNCNNSDTHNNTVIPSKRKNKKNKSSTSKACNKISNKTKRQSTGSRQAISATTVRENQTDAVQYLEEQTTHNENSENIQQDLQQQSTQQSEITILTETTTSEINSEPRILQNENRGDIFTKEKAMDTIRYIYQNINGLQIKRGLDKWMATVLRMIELQCDIVSINETCVNTRLTKIKRQLLQILRTVSKNSSLNCSSVPIVLDDALLPGGIAVVNIGEMNSKIEKVLVDPDNMGRWIGTTYRVSEKNRLHILTGYRVCANTIKANTSMSTYSQQYTMMLNRGIKKPDPRKQFLIDIVKFIKNLELTENDYLLITLDANNSNDNDHETINNLVRELNIVDMYMERHGCHEQFPTHENGSKRIDYILCSRNLMQFVQRVGYIKFNECFDSDHRAVFCDISTNILQTRTPNVDNRTRAVGTNSTNKEGDLYVKYINKFFEEHKIFEKVEVLFIKSTLELNEEDKSNMIKQLDILDKIITTTMLRAERTQCKKRDPAYWSPALVQSNLRIQYWVVLNKARRQRTDPTKRLQDIHDKMTDESIERIRNTTVTVKSALRKAIKEHGKLLKKHRELREEHLGKKREEICERGNGEQMVTLKSLIFREKNRQDFAFLRSIFKPNNNTGINNIDIPKTDGSDQWEKILEPTRIEKELLQYSKNHFGQAQSTPFTVDPIKSIFEYEGTNELIHNMIKKERYLQNLRLLRNM
jgi:hypothetical protein